MKIRQVGSEVPYANGRTDTTKLIIVLFAIFRKRLQINHTEF
jgi:hypothetical protein